MKYLRLSCLFFTLMASLCQAGVNDYLYRSQVFVNSESTASRQDNFTQALIQVLQKVSGNPFIAETEGLVPPPNQVAQLIQQYRYINKDKRRILEVNFQAQAINDLLKAHAQTIWNKNRPTLLLIVALDSGGQQQILGADNQAMPLKTLLSMAKQYGLPLITPEMDVEDLRLLSYDNVLSQVPEPMQAMARRYASDGVLSVSLSLDEQSRWQSHWVLDWKQQHSDWQINDDSFEQLGEDGLRQLSHLLQTQVKFNPQDENMTQWITLTIDEVDSSDAYQTVLDYLSSLPAIKQVELINILPQTIRYRVEINIPRSRFVKQLAKGDTLIANEQDDGETLHYRLNT